MFCEGARTEPEYLDALKRLPEVRDVAAVDLRVEPTTGGSAPRTLVSHAADAAKRASAEHSELDEIWCVFDVEAPVNHPNLNEAINMARGNGVFLAISNPCFEIWLALHFADRTRWLTTDEAQRLCRRHDPGSHAKGVDASVYMPRRHDAAARAADLDVRHERNGTVFPDNNPSSGMHMLVRSAESIAPQR